MAKVTITTLQNLDNPNTATGQINENFANIREELDNTLSRDGTSPNTMNALLDMNNQRIINLPAPENDNEPARKVDVANVIADAEAAIDEALAEAEVTLEGYVTDAETAATNAATSESNAATSEANAATSESNAAASEANALTAESNAETAEANAEAALAAAEALVAAFPTITRTDDTSAVGPTVVLDRISASPAASDFLGKIVFRGRDSGGNETDYADTFATLVSPTDAAEGGRLTFRTMYSGTLTQFLIVEPGTITMPFSENGASANPVLALNRASASPAANDNLGRVSFYGRDSAGATTEYAYVQGGIADPVDGSEDGTLRMALMVNGTSKDVFTVEPNTVSISGSAGSSRDLRLLTDGSLRWGIRANSVAEGGANAGSNLEINAYSDAGALLDSVLTINRALGVVSIQKTDDSASGGPILSLQRLSASPAASDTIGRVDFNGRDSGNTATTYGRIDASITNPTDGSETGQINFSVASAGTILVSSFIVTGFGIILTGGTLRFPSTQVPSTGANDLDDYEEGDWTPGLTFGGAAVGLTTSTASGRYQKVGKKVTGQFVIVLSAKGSSTGSAVITGLPFTTANITSRGSANIGFGTAMASLTSPPSARVLHNSTTIELFDWGATGAVTLDDTNFTNTTALWGTFEYEATQ